MKAIVCLAVLALGSTPLEAETIFDIYAPWRYRLGTQEASSPDTTTWRGSTFDDTQWGQGPAPIGYTTGGTVTGVEGEIRTFLPTSSQPPAYTTVYFRKSIVLSDVSRFVSLSLTVHVDDGAVVWFNGVEVARVNAPAGELPYNAQAQIADEVHVHTVSIPAGLFVEGGNVLAVHGLNGNTTSSDFVFAASLEGIRDEVPRVVSVVPPFDAPVNSLGLVEVYFNEGVTGVDAADFLLNGVAATNVVAYAPNDYLFYFAEPAAGLVQVSFASNHGIADTDGAPTAFQGTNWTYTLVTNAPVNMQISEFLADNSTNLEDEDGNNSDWIEIHNRGPAIANLAGWRLTDDPDDLTKWTFPAHLNMSLPANSYLLVWASGKDRTNAIGYLHTNFRLERSGEYMALVTPDLAVVSEFAATQQFTDVSYGRDPVDPQLTGYYVVPTPGRPNATSGPGFSQAPVFSVASGVFTANSITVAISANTNAVIRYTLDGSEPTNGSPVYSSAFVFSSNTVVKARAFEAGLWPSPVVARTYHFLDASVQNFSSKVPIVILSTAGRPIPQNIIGGGNRLRGSLVVIDTFRGRSSMQTTPQFQGLAQFEIYGQTAASFPKRPYHVEVTDELGNDLDVSLLGFPPEADFQLETKFSDKSLLNGFLSFELHEQMGHYAVRRKFVEVFVDTSGGKVRYPEDYVGVYTFVEKIERDRHRVDIAELTPSHTAEPDVSGGYIFKKDKDSAGDRNFGIVGINGFAAQTLKIHEPKPRLITAPQLLYISNYVHQFSASLHHPNWLQLTGTNHYSHYIDVDSFVDQHWIVEFTKNIDGYRLSRFWSKDRGGKIVDSPIWDFDLCFGNANYLQGGLTNGWYWNLYQEGMDSNNHPWHRRLLYGMPNINLALPVEGTGDPEFIQKTIDRWGELRANVLNLERVLARIDELTNLISEAAGRNYQKYDILRANVFTWPNPNGPPNWHVDYVNPTTYAGIISELKKWITGRYHWLEGQFVRAPQLNHPGGFINSGFTLTMTAPAGTIYYTLDGSDPRSPNGAVAAGAQVYSGPVAIDGNARVFARARNGTGQYSWSPPAAATLVVRTPPLRITEIMYHPAGEGLEYIAVESVEDGVFDPAGFRLSGGIDFTFPSLVLHAGQQAYVVENAAAFGSYYGSGYLVAGEYAGRLDNAGERLVLTGPLQEPILDFAYDDAWYPITDGTGVSLVIRDVQAPLSSWKDAASWRPSIQADAPPVLINEALSNPQSGAVDAIELHNPATEAVDVGGWYLTDNFDRRAYRIPFGTVIPAQGYVVLIEGQFDFGLAEEGEEVFLFSANDDGSVSGYVSGYTFGPQRQGITFGRHVTSTGAEHFVAQAARTLGGANAGPRLPDVVISEIMYSPRVVFANGVYWDNTEDEFVELHNRSGASVGLAGQSLTGAGIDYQFEPTALPSGAYLLVVSFDPANASHLTSFRTKYGVPAEVQIVGPYTGSLDSRGGALALQGGDLVLEEQVGYSDRQPWPAAADGLGLSLHRLGLNEYANDPANWNAGAPTAGRGFTAGAGPTITAHPQSQSVVAASTATATFSVSVTESGVNYQWRKDGENLPGANASTLTLTDIAPSDAGNYQAIVWNQGGYTASSNALLTVLIGIRILEQPRSQTVLAATNVVFKVSATSPSTISYQWRLNGINIPGANGPELLLSNVTEENEGLYDVLLTDAVGSVLSAAATLTVRAVPAMVAPVPPLQLTAAVGDTLTVNARLSGTLPIYARWRWIPFGGGNIILSNQILNERVASVSFVVPTPEPGRIRLSLTNAIGGSLGVAATNAIVMVLADSDGDRIPDAYERAHGLNENDPNDAAADPDGDTMSNRAEYIAGTDPQDPASYLKVERLEVANSATIHFSAISNRTYSVHYSDALNPPAWQKLQDLVVRPTNYHASVIDPASPTTRFYRLATP